MTVVTIAFLIITWPALFALTIVFYIQKRQRQRILDQIKKLTEEMNEWEREQAQKK